jgi:hypothetical protein
MQIRPREKEAKETLCPWHLPALHNRPAHFYDKSDLIITLGENLTEKDGLEKIARLVAARLERAGYYVYNGSVHFLNKAERRFERIVSFDYYDIIISVVDFAHLHLKKQEGKMQPFKGESPDQIACDPATGFRYIRSSVSSGKSQRLWCLIKKNLSVCSRLVFNSFFNPDGTRVFDSGFYKDKGIYLLKGEECGNSYSIDTSSADPMNECVEIFSPIRELLDSISFYDGRSKTFFLGYLFCAVIREMFKSAITPHGYIFSEEQHSGKSACVDIVAKFCDPKCSPYNISLSAYDPAQAERVLFTSLFLAPPVLCNSNATTAIKNSPVAATMISEREVSGKRTGKTELETVVVKSIFFTTAAGIMPTNDDEIRRTAFIQLNKRDYGGRTLNSYDFEDLRERLMAVFEYFYTQKDKMKGHPQYKVFETFHEWSDNCLLAAIFMGYSPDYHDNPVANYLKEEADANLEHVCEFLLRAKATFGKGFMPSQLEKFIYKNGRGEIAALLLKGMNSVKLGKFLNYNIKVGRINFLEQKRNSRGSYFSFIDPKEKDPE